MDTQEAKPSRGTTQEFAKTRHVKPQTVLKRLSQKGSYFGEKPLRKMGNGRWEWPLTPNEESTN